MKKCSKTDGGVEEQKIKKRKEIEYSNIEARKMAIQI